MSKEFIAICYGFVTIVLISLIPQLMVLIMDDDLYYFGYIVSIPLGWILADIVTKFILNRKP